jgi:HK97 gp10 family phage protein
MSFSISFTIDTKKLDALTNNLKKNAKQIGTEFIGPMGEGTAKKYAPVDTGLLRSSIHQEFPGGDIIAQIALLSADCNYAIYQELGTYKMAAQPFMAPMMQDMIWTYLSTGTWEPLFA